MEIRMGDLINCFYQCKQMPGLGYVAFIAEEKVSGDGDECACMRVRNGQSPKLGGLLVDEILFHFSISGPPPFLGLRPGFFSTSWCSSVASCTSQGVIAVALSHGYGLQPRGG